MKAHRPIHSVCARTQLNDRQPGDQFPGLDQGAVTDAALLTPVLHAPALARRSVIQPRSRACRRPHGSVRKRLTLTPGAEANRVAAAVAGAKLSYALLAAAWPGPFSADRDDRARQPPSKPSVPTDRRAADAHNARRARRVRHRQGRPTPPGHETTMRITELFGIDLPIIQAPLAGVQGSELAIAVCRAGGLGSLPCAMLAPEAIRLEVAAIRAATDRPYNLNFFCHTPPAPHPAPQAAPRSALARRAGALLRRTRHRPRRHPGRPGPSAVQRRGCRRHHSLRAAHREFSFRAAGAATRGPRPCLGRQDPL